MDEIWIIIVRRGIPIGLVVIFLFLLIGGGNGGDLLALLLAPFSMVFETIGSDLLGGETGAWLCCGLPLLIGGAFLLLSLAASAGGGKEKKRKYKHNDWELH